MEERRRALRVAIRKPATIHIENEKFPVKCVIIDFSSIGARLRLRKERSLPAAITLAVPGDNLVLDVAVRWRQGALYGVEFSRQIAHPHLTRFRRMTGADYSQIRGTVG